MLLENKSDVAYKNKSGQKYNSFRSFSSLYLGCNDTMKGRDKNGHLAKINLITAECFLLGFAVQLV